MKIIIATVIVAFCAVQIASGLSVNNLNTLLAQITRQKSAVKSTVSRVERQKRDFSYNVGNKIYDAKLNSMEEINSIVNPALKNIEDATKKSTAEGKDASHCYESARVSLREYSLKGFSDLEDCRLGALSSVSQTEKNMDSAILIGQSVISYLDSISPSCFTTNTLQMERCVASKLAEAQQQAKSFETTANAVISSANSAVNQGYLNAVNCSRGPVSNVRDGTTAARIDADRCIAAL